jgi:ATP-dependent protease Clp ATPase subunit
MTCSFCNVADGDTFLLIIGKSANICARCAESAADIVRERRRIEAEREYLSWFGGNDAR